MGICMYFSFFFSSRRRHTRCGRDWSSDVCSSDLVAAACSNTERLLQVVMELRILGGSHDRCFRTTHLPRLVEQAIAQAGLATVELDNALSARSTYIACNPRSEERRVGKESRYRGR